MLTCLHVFGLCAWLMMLLRSICEGGVCFLSTITTHNPPCSLTPSFTPSLSHSTTTCTTTTTASVTTMKQVKAMFGTGKKKVAGCLVDSGRLAKGAMIEVVRGSGKDKAVVFTGKLASLRRIKDTVEEVCAYECVIVCNCVIVCVDCVGKRRADVPQYRVAMRGND